MGEISGLSIRGSINATGFVLEIAKPSGKAFALGKIPMCSNNNIWLEPQYMLMTMIAPHAHLVGGMG